MNKSPWIGAVVGVLVVVGLGAYFGLTTSDTRQNGVPSTPRSQGATVSPGAALPGIRPPGLASMPAPTVLTPLLPPASTAPSGAGSAAPWITPGMPASSVSVGAGEMSAKGVPIGKPGAPSLDEVQKRLQALVANGRQATPLEVEAVLADLQRNQGSNVVNGVNLQMLRDNLVRTDRIQQIALEMQAIAATPRKEDLPRLQALSAEMQRLSSAMVPNVAQPTSR